MFPCWSLRSKHNSISQNTMYRVQETLRLLRKQKKKTIQKTHRHFRKHSWWECHVMTGSAQSESRSVFWNVVFSEMPLCFWNVVVFSGLSYFLKCLCVYGLSYFLKCCCVFFGEAHSICSDCPLDYQLISFLCLTFDNCQTINYMTIINLLFIYYSFRQWQMPWFLRFST